jgi:hypothetical protein
MLAVFAISVGLNCRKFFELKLNQDGTDYETTAMMEYAPYLVRSNNFKKYFIKLRKL